jgi:hypothetical protein
VRYKGAAYVYSLGDDGNWGLQQKLLPTNSDSTANKFGNAVATSGNVVVVGADLDDSQGVDSGEDVFCDALFQNLASTFAQVSQITLFTIRRCGLRVHSFWGCMAIGFTAHHNR